MYTVKERSDQVLIYCYCFSHEVVSNTFETLKTVAHQNPLSVEFPRQGYWIGFPFPSQRYLPDPGIVPIKYISITII